MHPSDFETLRSVILNRRTVKPEHMNGKLIPEETIDQLLELANWAPTHGYTEPWRFTVFSGEGLQRFSRFHAELYRQEAEKAGHPSFKYDKILHRADKVSHVISVGMSRGDNPKVPSDEEHISVGIAAQHIWLGAAALSLSCYWGSGGMTYHPEMRAFLELHGPGDKVLGFLYLGYSATAPRDGRRLTDIGTKVRKLGS